MVANFILGSKYPKEYFEKALAAQIENSIDLGWEPENIVILSNFSFKYMKVETIKTSDLNTLCLTGSKMFGVKWLLSKGEKELIWAHDLDAWQNVWFDPPKLKDVGICQYSSPKFNGGSIFWKSTGEDICTAIVDEILNTESPKEEPIIDKLFKSKTYKKRVSILNSSLNVGCSGFKERYGNGIKPIKVCHFHPNNRLAWKTFVLDKHNYGKQIITPRLRRVLERYYYGENF